MKVYFLFFIVNLRFLIFIVGEFEDVFKGEDFFGLKLVFRGKEREGKCLCFFRFIFYFWKRSVINNSNTYF